MITQVKTNMSTTTFTVRIPCKLKEKMDENPSEWSREVRCFLEERVKQRELIKIIDEIEKEAESGGKQADSTLLIREDRERPT